MSPGVELLTRDVRSCRGIRSSPMNTCLSPFLPRVRTVSKKKCFSNALGYTLVVLEVL